MTAVDAARALAADLLAPAAQDVDTAPLVPRGHLDALAAAGLYGLAGPRSHGGLGLARGEAREVVELLAAGCGATTFVWGQHHNAVRMLAESSHEALRERRLRPLCRGEQRAGVAYAHLRRDGPAAVRATTVPGGYRLDGRAPWMTGWGLVDCVLVAAPREDGRLVFGLVDVDAPGLGAEPLRLAVFGATGTVALAFDGTPLPDGRVVDVVDADEWRAADAVVAAGPSPLVLGVPRACLPLLPADVEAAVAAGTDACRAEADAALADLERSARVRARALELGQRAATAPIAAAGGRAMALDHPAQRLAREALFYTVQAQTAVGRAAVLTRAARR